MWEVSNSSDIEIGSDFLGLGSKWSKYSGSNWAKILSGNSADFLTQIGLNSGAHTIIGFGTGSGLQTKPNFTFDAATGKGKNGKGMI